MYDSKNPTAQNPQAGKHLPDASKPSTGIPDVDIGLQFNTALPAAQRSALLDELQSRLTPMFPAATPVISNDGLRIGIFLEHIGAGWDVHRPKAVERMHLNIAPELFAFALLISADFMYRQSREGFEAVPKRYSSKTSQPDDNGDIVLYSLNLDFIAPNTVSARLDGEAREAIDLDFTGTAIDRIAASGGALQVFESNKLVIEDVGLLEFLEGVLKFGGFFPGSFMLPALPALPSPTFLSALHPTAQLAGMLPRSVLIPHTSEKAVLTYRNAGVDGDGVHIGGLVTVSERQPFVKIVGDLDVDIYDFDTAGVFHLALRWGDLAGPIQIDWTAEAGALHDPDQPSTSLQLHVPPGVTVGAIESSTVKVVVRGSDGVEVHDRCTVRVHVVRFTPPNSHVPSSHGHVVPGQHHPSTD